MRINDVYNRLITDEVRNTCFRELLPVLGVKIKRAVRVSLIFMIDLSSATSMESSPRDLLNDMAEHKSILNYPKNNTNYPRFTSTPKTGKLPATG